MFILILLSGLLCQVLGQIRIAGSSEWEGENASYAIFIADENFRWCTGGIIDPFWILTSAHCALRKHAFLVTGMHNATQMMAELGRNTSHFLKTKRILVHPKHKYGFNVYDIALIQVKKRIGEKPVPLGTGWPSMNEPLLCQVVGYGRDPINNRKKGVLRGAHVLAKHGTGACPCFTKYKSKRSICLKSLVQPCESDWGQLLVCNGSAYGVVHAIAWLHTCEILQFKWKNQLNIECGEPGSTAVYTFICPVLNWIRIYVKSAPEPPLSCQSHKNYIYLSCILFTQIILFSG